MRIRIEKIVYPGRSLARLDGRTVFVDEGLPGELVEIESIKEKKNFLEARTVGIIERSAQRVAPRCDHFKACAPWQNMEYDLQLELKRDQVREIFSRQLRVDLQHPDVVPSPQIWGYRNRARFHVLWEDEKARAAYHEPGSEERFIRADDCRLVPDEINAFLEGILKAIGDGHVRGVNDIEIKRSDSEGRLLAAMEISSASEAGKLRECLAGLKPEFPLAGIVALISGKKGQEEIALLGKKYIEEIIGGLRFRIGARSFFQVNTGQLIAVAEEMRRAAAASGEARIADLYCGVGTFGLLLARKAKEILGIEPEPENIDFLKKNLALNGIGNFTLFEGTSEEWIGDILDRDVDVVILDPPRKGLHPELVRALAERPVRTIIYLSCNPATLARDLHGLLQRYELSQVKVFDFFPQTPHIETLALLHRGERIQAARPAN